LTTRIPKHVLYLPKGVLPKRPPLDTDLTKRPVRSTRDWTDLGLSHHRGSAAYSSSFGSNFNAAPLMQYRNPVGFGPSSKTWPRWPSQLQQTTSVRCMP